MLVCGSILLTQWGLELMAKPNICDAIIALIHGCVKDKNTVVQLAECIREPDPDVFCSPTVDSV